MNPLFQEQDSKETSKHEVVAYLNLLANAIDNFSHGLAIGASFVIGYKVSNISIF